MRFYLTYQRNTHEQAPGGRCWERKNRCCGSRCFRGFFPRLSVGLYGSNPNFGPPTLQYIVQIIRSFQSQSKFNYVRRKKSPTSAVGDVFVGTHALIHQKVPFDKVALVVIDEQHRFGVEQRAHLTKIVGKKAFCTPMFWLWTATPIPRTIALTLYGDLDLSTLTELPEGRQKITTWVVPPYKEKVPTLDWRENRKEKVQAFIVCPLIEESEVETLKNRQGGEKRIRGFKKSLSEIKIRPSSRQTFDGRKKQCN